MKKGLLAITRATDDITAKLVKVNFVFGKYVRYIPEGKDMTGTRHRNTTAETCAREHRGETSWSMIWVTVWKVRCTGGKWEIRKEKELRRWC